MSAKVNKKLSKLLSKGFERSAYWNKYKTKNENKDITKKYRYFLKLNFACVSRLFGLVDSNAPNDAKRYSAVNCHLSKGIIKNFNVIISEKKLL